MIKLYSFDIFDTIITRRTATAYGVFCIMQYQLINDNKYKNIDNFLKQNFPQIRISTMEKLKKIFYQTEGNQEPFLEDIYYEIGKNYNLNNKDINILIQLEISIEKHNLIPINTNINKIKRLLNEQKKVILISDMYLSEKILRDILTQIDIIFKNIPIFVSCDLNKSKENKKLYKYIKEYYNINYSEWLHCGDNKVIDIKNAQELGINTVFYQKHILLQHSNIESLEYQAYLGSSKILNNKNNSEKYLFAIDFSAPILYSYVNWVLEQSQKRKINNLYFLTRDGYILKDIADIIIEKKNIPIKTHLFYGSRIALRIPTQDNLNSFIAIAFDDYKDSFSFKNVAQRLNISVSKLLQYLKIDIEKKQYANEDIKHYKNIALNSEKLKEHILNSFKDKRELALQYIKQLFDFNNKCAFVDLAGSGKTLEMLQYIIQTFSDYKIQAFYFYTNRMSQIPTYTYFPAMKGCMLWIELLCRYPIGQTLGYEININSNKIVPIFEKVNIKPLLYWGYKSYRQGIKDFSKVMAEFEINNNLQVYSFNILNDYFDILLSSKNRYWANMLGSVPSFKTFGYESSTKNTEIAPPFSFINVLTNKTKDPLSFIRFARTHKIYFKIKKIFCFRRNKK